jgi:hypothetical protein
MPVERAQESAGSRPPEDTPANRFDDRLPAAPGGALAAGATRRPAEVGGPSGPEPTRYGDWERAGRCIDF